MINLSAFSGCAGRAEWWLISTICNVFSVAALYGLAIELSDEIRHPGAAAIRSLGSLGTGLVVMRESAAMAAPSLTCGFSV